LIIDTSALVAIVLAEPHWTSLRDAVTTNACVIPAPVLTEVQLTTPKHGSGIVAAARALITEIVQQGGVIAAFGQPHADITATARDLYGKGNGKGGRLNFGDLMVYAIAKERGMPLLCTGEDFASTDLVLHPASRLSDA
jgi:ribonuclease VapC